MEGRGRAKQEARAKNNAGEIVEFTQVNEHFEFEFPWCPWVNAVNAR